MDKVLMATIVNYKLHLSESERLIRDQTRFTFRFFLFVLYVVRPHC